MATQLVVLILWSLAVVLLVSGALKVGHSTATLRSLHDLRVPRALRRRLTAQAVPVVEMVAGVGLLLAPAPAFTVVALGASVLFGVFFVLTLAVVARGERVVCACFGAQAARPIDSIAVARNGLLLAGAATVTVGAREGAVLWMLGFGLVDWTVFFGAATALLALALVVLLVGRSRASVRVPNRAGAASGAPGGSLTSVAADRPSAAEEPWPVPDLEVTDATGRAVELASIARTRPVLLVLLSAECTPCGVVAGRMPHWRAQFGATVEIAVITSASPEDFAARYPGLDARMFYGYRSLMTAAGIEGVPSALLLGTDRRVAAGPAQGLDEVVGLAEAIVSAIPAPDTRTTISSSHKG